MSHSNTRSPSQTQELPGYTSNSGIRSTQRVNRTPKEFQYKIEKGGKPIAVLTLFTEAGVAKTIPTYVEGSMIKGNLRLSLNQADSIQGITVKVQGQYITGVNPDDQLNFLDISQTLWSQLDGPPRNATSDQDSSLPPAAEQPPSKFTGKLQGEYLWPFAIDFPRKVNLSLERKSNVRDVSEPFAPPQTFTERNVRGGINYELSIRIARGRFKADRRMSTQFGYIPSTRPPALLPMRWLAYQQGTQLIGPHTDADGWHAQEAVQIRGNVFDNRPVNITCKLYISKPLSYTRGSVIPLYLHLESNDKQALDLLALPKAISVHLRRHVSYGLLTNKANTKGITYNSAAEDSLPAVWWPSTSGPDENPPQSDRSRYVNGELHLKIDLKPTSDMPLLRVEYFVVMLPFNAAGFVQSGEDMILKQPVDIVTTYAPGPRPVKLAPPGYDLETTMKPTFTSTKNNFI